MAAALAAAASPGLARADALSTASKAVALDLTAGARAGMSGVKIDSLTYSGSGWAKASGGSATVTGFREGSADGVILRLVDGATGEGTFSFTPAAAGTWALTHASDGGEARARFAVASNGAEAEGVALSADSAKVALDLAAGTRTIADLSEIGGITYSGGNWVYGAEGTAYTGLAGPGVAATVTERTGEGTYAFTPGAAGLWTLTHTVGDATVVARFQIEASAIDVGPGDEGGASWLNEDAIANATAVVITAITQASADSWNVTFRPVLQPGRDFAEWVETSYHFDNIRIRRATTLAGLDSAESEVEPIEAVGYDEAEGTVTVTIEATDDAAMFFRIVIED